MRPITRREDTENLGWIKASAIAKTHALEGDTP
jgi:hypothetical protein